ncbi:MAG: hypothetical protein VX730_03640 [Pseudomonadota bacterium]|nr:hypothetical protein [Pseudomonadota bacterium]
MSQTHELMFYKDLDAEITGRVDTINSGYSSRLRVDPDCAKTAILSSAETAAKLLKKHPELQENFSFKNEGFVNHVADQVIPKDANDAERHLMTEQVGKICRDVDALIDEHASRSALESGCSIEKLNSVTNARSIAHAAQGSEKAQRQLGEDTRTTSAEVLELA